MKGPTNPVSEQLHAEKYRSEGESFRAAVNRLAGVLCDSQLHFYEIREIIGDMRFLPGGRIQAAIGSTKQVTAYNCYVSGTIEDSFVSDDGSIMQRATEAAATMRMGGGIGYDFSTLRPRGAHIAGLDSHSSGPVSFMGIFDAVCKCVASSGHRRGAQMGIMRIDHPDIEEFINAKQNRDRLTGFNMSVGVTDKFMECLESGEPFPLVWNGHTYRKVEAKALWDKLMQSTWDWAEPGVVFIDRIHHMNNLFYCEQIRATNPCGEQPLPPFGACLLGSFNLTKYLVNDNGVFRFDYNKFRADIAPIVRAMDNVVDHALYPLPEQKKEALSKRRMGLGITGLANTLETMGYPYGSREFLVEQERIMTMLRDCAYEASVQLAIEKDPFPLFDSAKYCQSNFILTLPEELQNKIRKFGIRNSHLLSIAPTGTISLTADNISSSIEPVFALEVERTVRTLEGEQQFILRDFAYDRFGTKARTTSEVTVEEHLAVLTVASRLVDSAVSKTCNVPGSTSYEEFKQIYVNAYKMGAKGCTTFRIDGKRFGILKAREEEAVACRIDPATGKKDCE